MQHSTKAEMNAAWQKAKADADAVEVVALGQRSERREHARKEGQILDRLRTKEYAELVGEVWLRMKRYQKNGNEGQRVIMALLNAFTRSEMVRLLPTDYRQDETPQRTQELC